MAVEVGSRFTLMRSTTATGFDSSSSGGSFSGKNASRKFSRRDAKIPGSSTSRSLSAGRESSFRGACFTGLKKSRRFEKSEAHIEPSVSSTSFGPSAAGGSIVVSLFGSVSGGGINTVFAICSFRLGSGQVVPPLRRLPWESHVSPLLHRSSAGLLMFYREGTASGSKIILQSFTIPCSFHWTYGRGIGSLYKEIASCWLSGTSSAARYNRPLAHPRNRIKEERMPEVTETKPQTTQTMAEAKPLKSTLNLPQTAFAMKANLPVNEPLRLAAWQKQDIYTQIRTARADAPKYILHDGPPYANGAIHLGH